MMLQWITSIMANTAITGDAINATEGAIGFIDGVRLWAENNAFLNSFSGILNSSLVLGGIIFFNRYVAPKLAKANWFNSELSKVYAKLEEVDTHIQENTGLELNLAQNLNGIKEILDVAFSSSNLSLVSKQLIKNIIMRLSQGETEGLKEQMDQLSEDGKELAEKLIKETTAVADDLRKTALQQLQESIETEEE